MKQQRIAWVDVASGILILWVMAFHAMNTSKVFGSMDVRVALPFLTFSMPWFYYKSGMLFKADRGAEGVRKDYRKFVIPFLKWGLAGYAVYLLMHALTGTLTWEVATLKALDTIYIYGYIPANPPTWFILSLFLVRVCGQALIRWKVSPWVSALSGLAVGYLFHLVQIPWLPFIIANVAMGITFFMMGYGYSKFESNKWLTATCAVGYVLFLVFGCSIVGHHRNVLLCGHFLLWPVFAYCGIVTFNHLCRLVAGVMKHTIRPITFVGEHAMTLLVSHALVYMPAVHLSPFTPWTTVGIIFVGYLGILLLVARHSAK